MFLTLAIRARLTWQATARYYSRKGWEIGGTKTVDELEHRVDSIVHALGR